MIQKFIIQILVFSALLVASFFLILTRADGRTDPYYLRFTTPPQQNLILGSSRAAQGLQPAVINPILDENIFNYSFTISHSPYGKVYLESIKRKLDPESKDGTFIVTADPWSISSQLINPNDEASFRELGLCLDNTHEVNRNPNFEYLLKNLQGQYHKLIFRRRTEAILHPDGWLEISVLMKQDLVDYRTGKKIESYREYLPRYNFSSKRLEYLKETIEFLKSHGRVYLVRLPVSPEMMAIEREFMPEFDEIMLELSNSTEAYLDLTPYNASYEYTDGNHLYKSSGAEVSRKIAQWIRTEP